MKPTRNGSLVEGNLTGRAVEMTIDATAMQHIMAVLTDLYSDPLRAVLREYSTNAIDSHIEAGNSDPIEVTLPSGLSPFLRIKDNGVGLSADEIEAMYSKYGASTKRDTNEQTGMLGLGSKSALTYAEQFTIVGRKDGEKISVAVSRNAQGGGTMTVVNRMETSEPNGVEIVIPAQRDDADTAIQKADELFRYWPAGTVLVNGKPPKRFSGLQVTDGIYLVEDEGNAYSHNSRRYSRYYYDDDDSVAGEHTCVMGNVPYPMKLPKDTLPWGVKMVAFVPIGAINFTPSREALHYTPHTNAAIKKIVEDYKAGVNGAIQREIDKAKDHAAALKVVADWQKYLNVPTTFTYKGDDLPSEYSEVDPHATGTNKGQKRSLRVTGMTDRYGRLSGYNSHQSISAAHWPETLWVQDFNPADVGADHKRKLTKYVEDNGLEGLMQAVMLHGKVTRNKFMNDKHIVSYPDDIRTIVLPKASAPARGYGEVHIKGAYRVWTEAEVASGLYKGEQVEGDKIRQSHLIAWQHGGKYAGRREAQELAAVYDKFTLVMLPSNRVDKFKRDVPKAVTVSEAIEVKRTAWEAKLTDDEKLALAIHDANMTDTLKAYDPTKIHDPDLTNSIRLSNVKVSKLISQRRVFGSRATTAVKWSNPLAKYPLLKKQLGHYGDRDKYLTPDAKTGDHVYLYINCVYANATKGSSK